MSVDTSTLEGLSGKNVILHQIADDGSVVELEGKVEAASEMGVAFKEKGKRDVVLVEVSQIEEISAAPTKPKTLAQKKLKLIGEGQARQHLLDRHGYERSTVNGLTDEQAFQIHEDIDHADLGHRHEETKVEESDDEE